MFTQTSLLTADFSRAVLIDFDAARPDGYRFTGSDKRGDIGFMRQFEELTVSEKENHLFARRRLRLWLEDPKAAVFA